MKTIKCIEEFIAEEIEDATKYAKLAVKIKDENPSLAKTYYDLSVDELRHMSLLHDEVVAIIEAYRREHGEPPERMMAIYDYLHEQHVSAASIARVYQAMYREEK